VNIDLILNLTVPDAHFGVSLAGGWQHVYSKTTVLSMKHKLVKPMRKKFVLVRA
jgi:hypothetical protein